MKSRWMAKGVVVKYFDIGYGNTWEEKFKGFRRRQTVIQDVTLFETQNLFLKGSLQNWTRICYGGERWTSSILNKSPQLTSSKQNRF